LAVKFAISEVGDVNVFADHQVDKEIGLGVLDVRGQIIESPEVIVTRVPIHRF
jgi:methionine synthase II (cobalamin-independent)